MPSRTRRPRPGGAGVAVAALMATMAAAVTAPSAADEVEGVGALLERMVRASRSLDYIGTFVYRNGPTIQSLKIIHRADEDGSRERLVALSGAAREVIRDGRRVTCILPDHRTVLTGIRQAGQLQPMGVVDPHFTVGQGIARSYMLSGGKHERVAGRAAMGIDVRPKDKYRYGFRIAVDQETGLLLKSELLDDDGSALEQIVYTHLELPDSIPDEALEPQISDAGFTRREDSVPDAARAGPEVPPREWTVDRLTWAGTALASARKEAPPREWTVDWLPPGFRLTGESYGSLEPGRNPVDHRVYSDGLVSFSVFIERGLDAGGRLEGHSSMGAVNVFSRSADDFQLSVVGEVPGVTVEKVAASIVKR